MYIIYIIFIFDSQERGKEGEGKGEENSIHDVRAKQHTRTD